MFYEFLKRNSINHHRAMACSPDYDSAEEIEYEAKDPGSQQYFDACLRKMFDLEIYNAHKSLDRPPFNDPKHVNDGLHPFRRVYSQYAHKSRTLDTFDNVIFDEVGIVRFSDYLEDDEVDIIRKEFDQFQVGVVNKQPHNIIAMNEKKAPAMLRAVHKMKDLIIKMIGEETDEIRLKYYGNTFAQRVDNDPNDNDNQKNSHVDTFFPAIKWWYFPDEVKLKHGPLCYAQKSCVPSDNYLDWLYQESIKCVNGTYDDWKLKDHAEGSFRANDQELADMGLKVEPVPVKANTLVVANVAGFHRRGDTTVRHVRNAIHGSIRIDNPFSWGRQ